MRPLKVKCARCEAVISARRLEAVPNTRLCVVCQNEVERGMMRGGSGLARRTRCDAP